MVTGFTHKLSLPRPVSPAIPPPNEVELIRMLRQRQESAFSELYRKYSAALYNILLKIVKEETLAEDLLQESFVKIWHHFSEYDEQKGRLFTWILNVTRNLAIDKTRTRAYKQQSHTLSVDVGKEYTVALNNHLPEWMGLEKLLPYLKTEEKILIELIYYQGYTGPEVSQQLNIPLGTIKTRLRAAMGKLRQCFPTDDC